MRDGLVSRIKIMAALVKEYNYRRQQEDWEGGLKLAWIEKAVNSVPDAEGIVQCRECRHAKQKDYAPAQCPWYCTLSLQFHKGWHYCSYGERREDDKGGSD